MGLGVVGGGTGVGWGGGDGGREMAGNPMVGAFQR